MLVVIMEQRSNQSQEISNWSRTHKIFDVELVNYIPVIHWQLNTSITCNVSNNNILVLLG